MHYDAIIIGSGAGGGTLAYALAKAGRNILILERGDYVRRERQNWDPREVFQNGRYISPDSWLDGDGNPFQPQSHYNVGGATKFYGAALYRLREQDFGELRHADGISPAWPIDYAALEPWYTQAEWLYQVHGNHGEDPTEGAYSRQYPWPAVAHEQRIQELSDNLAMAGYYPFHAPCGVLLEERADPARVSLPVVSAKSSCLKCSTCDGYPCMVHAKADAEVIAIRPILDFPNVTLVTNAEVRRLLTLRGRGEVSHVEAVVNGETALYSGDVVVLSAGAANSAKILLQSATDAHPNGLANGSDQVGRNFTMHNCRAVIGIDTVPNRTQFQKTLGVNDFYFAGRGHLWPLGNIQMVGKSNAAAMRGESALAKLCPEMPLAKVAAHAIDFWLTTEDLPLPQNRVTLARDGRIQLAYKPTNQQAADDLYRELRRMLGYLGIERHMPLPRHSVTMSKGMPLAAVAHQAGTTRFGTDPAASVLDVNCRAHEVSNLYVVDSSFMPSIGAVNPALTIMANALRVADYLNGSVL